MDLTNAINKYNATSPVHFGRAVAALFDMDGVLYDSMPMHTRAWRALCRREGLGCDPDEFYRREGATGAATIDALYRRQYGHGADADTCTRLYAIKSAIFAAMPEPPVMPGAQQCIASATALGLHTVLVTGSGQQSILQRLRRDYGSAFAGRTVTSADVRQGKPYPEPYLRGMALAHAEPWQSIAVDNAPLGVASAAAAGAFTIGVVTGPLGDDLLASAGAHLVLHSMTEVKQAISALAQL